MPIPLSEEFSGRKRAALGALLNPAPRRETFFWRRVCTVLARHRGSDSNAPVFAPSTGGNCDENALAVSMHFWPHSRDHGCDACVGDAASCGEPSPAPWIRDGGCHRLDSVGKHIRQSCLAYVLRQLNP